MTSQSTLDHDLTVKMASDIHTIINWHAHLYQLAGFKPSDLLFAVLNAMAINIGYLVDKACKEDLTLAEKEELCRSVLEMLVHKLNTVTRHILK